MAFCAKVTVIHHLTVISGAYYGTHVAVITFYTHVQIIAVLVCLDVGVLQTT